MIHVNDECLSIFRGNRHLIAIVFRRMIQNKIDDMSLIHEKKAWLKVEMRQSDRIWVYIWNSASRADCLVFIEQEYRRIKTVKDKFSKVHNKLKSWVSGRNANYQEVQQQEENYDVIN
jgi:hypothetical protein